jgi:hypothetical protein
MIAFHTNCPSSQVSDSFKYFDHSGISGTTISIEMPIVRKVFGRLVGVALGEQRSDGGFIFRPNLDPCPFTRSVSNPI